MSRVTTGNRPRRALALAIGVGMWGALLAGCGGSTSEGAKTPGPQPTANADNQVITVGTDPTHPPHDFLDKDGKIVGWERDFMEDIGKELGRPIKYESAAFAALLPGLQAKRYDLVFANVGVSAEREAAVDMVTVLNSSQAFLGQKDSQLKLSTLDTLCGVTLGTSQGSQQADAAAKQSAACTAAGKKPINIKLFPTGEAIILAVESGRAEVYWTSAPIAQYYASQPDTKLKVLGIVPDTENQSAIAFPKDSPLVPEVHKAVQKLIDDGTYASVLEKWGLSDNAITKSVVNPNTSK